MRVLDGLPSRTLFPPPASTRRLDKYNRHVHVFYTMCFIMIPNVRFFLTGRLFSEWEYVNRLVFWIFFCQKVNLLRSLLDNWYYRPYWKFEQNEKIKKNLK